MSSPRLFSIVLAAGQSSRFGSTKQLAVFEGVSLARRAVSLANAISNQSSLLVLGHDWLEVLRSCLPDTGFFVLNSEYGEGMATSLRAGIGALPPNCDAAMVLLADQPLITAEHLQLLKSTFLRNPDSIVASQYSGILGPPAIFPARTFGVLCSLTGDSGARRLLNDGAEPVVSVQSELAAADVDTPGDLQAIRRD